MHSHFPRAQQSLAKEACRLAWALTLQIARERLRTKLATWPAMQDMKNLKEMRGTLVKILGALVVPDSNVHPLRAET